MDNTAHANTDPATTDGGTQQARRTTVLRKVGQIASGVEDALASLAALVVANAVGLFVLYEFTGPGPISRDLVLHLAIVAGGIAGPFLVLVTMVDGIMRRRRYRRLVAEFEQRSDDIRHGAEPQDGGQ